MSHTPLDEVANKSILNRQNYLKKLIKLEKSIHYYNQHIEKVESMEECDTLLTSIMNMVIPYKD